MFCQISVLKNFSKPFFRPRLWNRCFHGVLCKLLRKAFSIEHLQWLLLEINNERERERERERETNLGINKSLNQFTNSDNKVSIFTP